MDGQHGRREAVLKTKRFLSMQKSLKSMARRNSLVIHKTALDAEIVTLIANAESVGSAQEGDEVFVLLNRTPFYGESGGQVGDTGTIESQNAKLVVQDTLKPSPDLIVHKCKVLEGEITPYTGVHAKIDTARRKAVAVSHTATHLLHSGLRQILGNACRTSRFSC